MGIKKGLKMKSLKKMFLNNQVAVKCENQEEVDEIYEFICKHTEPFLKRYKEPVFDIIEGIFPKYVYCSHKYGNVCEWKREYEETLQVTFKDGEFNWVLERLSKNNFEEYGFEADFEGEILKEINSLYYGIVKQHDKFESITWNLVGMPISGSTALNKYELWELKPIKKEWYENPDNFPCVIYDCFEEIFTLARSFSCNTFDLGYDIRSLEDIRPATQEEVLKLIIEE